MTVYIVMTLGSFMVVIRMRDEEGRQIETIASLSGMSKTRPGLALAFMALMFSLAGIPPLLGFYPKLAVFNAAVAEGLFPLAVLAVELGRAHVCTPVTNAQLVCRLMHEKTKNTL